MKINWKIEDHGMCVWYDAYEKISKGEIAVKFYASVFYYKNENYYIINDLKLKVFPSSKKKNAEKNWIEIPYVKYSTYDKPTFNSEEEVLKVCETELEKLIINQISDSQNTIELLKDLL